MNHSLLTRPFPVKVVRSLDRKAAFVLRHRWVVYYAVVAVYALLMVSVLRPGGGQKGAGNPSVGPEPVKVIGTGR